MDEETQLADEMFPIFIIAMLAMVVVPWTLGKCLQTQKKEVKATGGKVKRKSFVQKMCQTDNIILMVLWTIFILLSVYVGTSHKSEKPFDPFEVLEIPSNADMRTIKSAYRKLSLKYHPDKNPDPQAAVYFSDYVSKAYKTLTDDAARENWQKYGHPDGPRSTKLGVALPSFLFQKEYSVLLLIGIVCIGILVPICISIAYLGNSKRYTSNNVIVETISIWGHTLSPVSIKQAQSLHRILETFTCAAEWCEIKLEARNKAPLDFMLKELRRINVITDVDKFCKRRMEIIKAHLIFLCHLQRIPIPNDIMGDAMKILKDAPRLLGELYKVAAMPRVAPFQYGWFAPSEAVVEMMQCLSQAVGTEDKRPKSGKGAGTGPMLQLPHFDDVVIRKLNKGGDGIRIKTLTDLQNIPREKSLELMKKAGLSEDQVQDAREALDAQPHVDMLVNVYTDGEEEIMALDPVKCDISLKLTRPNHKLKNITTVPELQDKSTEGYTPRYPFPRNETWYILVGDTKANCLYTWKMVELGLAEECGYEELLDSQNGKKDATTYYQKVPLKFVAPPAGIYELTVMCMSSCWLGCDAVVHQKLKIENRVKLQNAQNSKPAPEVSKSASKPQKEKSKDKEIVEDNADSDTDSIEIIPSKDDIQEVKENKPDKEHSDSDEYSDSEEDLSDFSYDSQDTGTDIDEEDIQSESACWTIAPKVDEVDSGVVNQPSKSKSA